MISDGEKSQFALYAVLQELHKRGEDFEKLLEGIQLQLIAGKVRPNPRETNEIFIFVKDIVQEVTGA